MWCQRNAQDFRITGQIRIGRRDIALAIGELVRHRNVLYRDIGEAWRQESEPATGFDMEGTFFTDLDLQIRQSRWWRIVLATVTNLVLDQVEANHTGTNTVERIVIGTVDDRCSYRCRKPQRRAIAQRDLTYHVGAERKIIRRQPRRITGFDDLEIKRSGLAGCNRADVRTVTFIHRCRCRDIRRILPYFKQRRTGNAA